ncbi:MAG: DUF6713 family protein [Pseudomonadota bacterium]|nr:DUF6713 family protein [Pseudomonadota bacterium]
MKQALNLSLIVAVALFSVHEMDAMTHAEWRLLPILSGMQEDAARGTFVLLHIPIYIGVFWALFVASWKQLAGRIFSFAVFAHAAAHFLLSDHNLYTFNAPIETITVYGAALASLIYLGLSFKGVSE